MRRIAIGDIHGCAKTLRALLKQIAPKPEDHLIFIGDYIDRGPDSKDVITQLLALKDQCQCTFLRGNHEALMLKALATGDREHWYVNGGLETENSYLVEGRVVIDPEHVAFIEATELYLDMPDYFFVHAGVKSTLSIAENIERFGEEVFLWERSHLDAYLYAWEKPVVCGHTPQRYGVLDKPDVICIDTGCVFAHRPGLGFLAALELPRHRFIMVDNCEGDPD